MLKNLKLNKQNSEKQMMNEILLIFANNIDFDDMKLNSSVSQIEMENFMQKLDLILEENNCIGNNNKNDLVAVETKSAIKISSSKETTMKQKFKQIKLIITSGEIRSAEKTRSHYSRRVGEKLF